MKKRVCVAPVLSWLIFLIPLNANALAVEFIAIFTGFDHEEDAPVLPNPAGLTFLAEGPEIASVSVSFDCPSGGMCPDGGTCMVGEGCTLDLHPEDGNLSVWESAEALFSSTAEIPGTYPAGVYDFEFNQGLPDAQVVSVQHADPPTMFGHPINLFPSGPGIPSNQASASWNCTANPPCFPSGPEFPIANGFFVEITDLVLDEDVFDGFVSADAERSIVIPPNTLQAEESYELGVCEGSFLSANGDPQVGTTQANIVDFFFSCNSTAFTTVPEADRRLSFVFGLVAVSGIAYTKRRRIRPTAGIPARVSKREGAASKTDSTACRARNLRSARHRHLRLELVGHPPRQLLHQVGPGY